MEIDGLDASPPVRVPVRTSIEGAASNILAVPVGGAPRQRSETALTAN